MCASIANVESPSPGDERADHLRDVVERELPTLHRRIGTLVYRVCGPLRRDEIAGRVTETLNESVQRALHGAERFEMGRSAVAWLIGIALRILQEQQRSRKKRPISQSELGDEAWQQALTSLCSPAEVDAATVRLDVRQALARLPEGQRRILELRFFNGLDGEELAREISAPSAGAARVRLTRALQALRVQFGSAGEEGML
jgi:RNA polymerase sigma factor (sigma-70 family)